MLKLDSDGLSMFKHSSPEEHEESKSDSNDIVIVTVVVTALFSQN